MVETVPMLTVTRPPALEPVPLSRERRRSHVAGSARKRGKAIEPRGREARLRTEFGYLYPGIAAGEWVPVESLINQVVTLLYGDPGKSGVITGSRLLCRNRCSTENPLIVGSITSSSTAS